jgi:hypothetical protein
MKTTPNRAKIAGARLLCNVLERRTRLEKAAAFRKWTCYAGAIKASTNQKDAAVALSHQLEITREKLTVLKTHMKRGRRSHAGEDKRPRLRSLLMPKRDKFDFEGSEDGRLDI